MRRDLPPLLLAAALLAVGSAAASAPAARTEPPAVEKPQAGAPAEGGLPLQYRQWLEEVSVLITEEERQVFLGLQKDYQRDAFIDRFWRERDPYPDTGRNELRERWSERVDLARATFRRLDDARAKVLLLNGAPEVQRRVQCRAAFWPLELWFYPGGSDLFRSRFVVLFYQPGGGGPFRIWHQSFGRQELVSFDTDASCQPDDVELIRIALRWIDEEGDVGYRSLLDRVSSSPGLGGREWVATFNSYSTDLPAGAETFAAEVALDFPGFHQNRTVVQGAVLISPEAVKAAELGGEKSYNFVLTGEVLQGPALFDSFRYKFDLPAAALPAGTAGARMPLVFQRYLRPGGPYTLVVKVEDLAARRFFRLERAFEVPRVTEPELAPPLDPRLAEVLAEANAALAAGETTVKVVPPFGDLLTGFVRFDTVVTGSEVRQVRFELDGEPILTKTKPPFSVELDLGDFPRPHTLRATAFAESGEELASHEMLVNLTGSRFRVRLTEPHRGKRYEKSLRARAEVEVPQGDACERVEMYLNDTLVATLYQPPYVQPILLPEKQESLFVRAVAYRTDGGFSEDVVFLNTPGYGEEVAIQLVELYTSVLDRQGRPVTGLQQGDFRVKEDGVEQEIARFEQVRDLPFHAAIVLDTSASMADRIEAARAAALEFFEHSIRPRDRAALLTFNDRPYLTVPFTNDPKVFGPGLAGLKAERGTALHDSLIYSLFYFTGVTGQRALIVISDGKDESSRFEFDQALEYARRAGITVYTISLGLEKKEAAAKKALTRLADETGGRSFFLGSIAELPAVYSSIEEELRSQYLVAYQSKNTARDRAFRSIDLEVARRGVEVKTLRGYYP